MSLSSHRDDSNGGPRTYKAGGLPPGLSIDPPAAVSAYVVLPWNAEHGPVCPHVIISDGIPVVIRRPGDLVCWPTEAVAAGVPLTFSATMPPGLCFDAAPA